MELEEAIKRFEQKNDWLRRNSWFTLHMEEVELNEIAIRALKLQKAGTEIIKMVTRKKFFMDDWARDTRVMAEFLADLGERVVPSKERLASQDAVEWVFFPLDGSGPTPDKDDTINRNMEYLDELIEVEEAPRLGIDYMIPKDVVELKRLFKSGYRFITYFKNGEKWAFRHCPSKLEGEWFFEKTVTCETVDPECFTFMNTDYDIIDIKKWGLQI